LEYQPVFSRKCSGVFPSTELTVQFLPAVFKVALMVHCLCVSSRTQSVKQLINPLFSSSAFFFIALELRLPNTLVIFSVEVDVWFNF